MRRERRAIETLSESEKRDEDPVVRVGWLVFFPFLLLFAGRAFH